MPDPNNVERLARHMHDHYLLGAKAIGWPIRDGMDLPYDELSEQAKELDRIIARAVLSFELVC